ncbi:MAG: hypothetical protein ACFFBD_06735, partial [Candidatus Hodarchaeota archaeon]
RLWTVDMNDITSELIVKSVVKTVCGLILDGDASLELLSDQDLPPRYKIGFSFADDTKRVFIPQKGVVGKQQPEIPTINPNALIEPFLGRKIPFEEAFESLVTACHAYLKEHATARLEEYDSSNPSHLFFLALQEGTEKGNLKEVGNIIGRHFKSILVDEAHPDLKPNHIIKGIGLLPLDTISELMFYGKEKLCANLPKDLCNFLVYIWEEFISQTLNKRFLAEEPLCAMSATSLCIYSFKTG